MWLGLLASILVACGPTIFSSRDEIPEFQAEDYLPTLEQDPISELAQADLENGARIYYNGVSNSSGRIEYTGGPDFGGMMPMMNAYLSCSACHGPGGQGGRHVMHMQTMDAPDIRLSALRSHEAEEEHQDEADDDHHDLEYGLNQFRSAVVLGQHPDGDPLDDNMPRWELSDADLIDLLAFLAILP